MSKRSPAKQPFTDELPVLAHDQVQVGTNDELTETERIVLQFTASQPRRGPEIANHLRNTSRSGNLYKSMDRHRMAGFLQLTIPDKPQSKNQKMRITEKGIAWLARKGNGNV
jgi:DNA-binding PadR family transcriptional regulator